jgi:hypothetical protein
MSAETARNMLRQRFVDAATSAYDLNDVLAAFWSYAKPLAMIELKAAIGATSSNAPPTCLSLLDKLDKDSFDRGGFFPDDIARLFEIISEFRAIGFEALSDILQSFVATMQEIAAHPPDNSYCQGGAHPVACQRCGETWRYQIWDVINTAIRPDLLRAATDGSLTAPIRCYVCDFEHRRPRFFYCNPDREEFIIFWPYGDHPDLNNTVQMFSRCLEQMPLEMRGGKDTVVVIDGPPVAILGENVAGITIIRDEEEFLKTVNDPIMFYVEPWSNLSAFEDYEEAKEHLHSRNWTAAMRALARSFLADQVKVSFLENIAACLRNVSRLSEAEEMTGDAVRLRELLMKNGIIHRVVRKSIGSPVDPPLQFEILTNGLPPAWRFSNLISRVRQIAESER